jgi:hypothetical protein
MPSQPPKNRTSRPVVEDDRRGAVSRFESLLRLEDRKTPSTQRDAGTGAAVIYLRVSTQRQLHTAIDLDPDGNSIATQREATIKRAKRLKAPIAQEFVEPGHSAQSIAKRPVFRELLRYVEEHPEVGTSSSICAPASSATRRMPRSQSASSPAWTSR